MKKIYIYLPFLITNLSCNSVVKNAEPCFTIDKPQAKVNEEIKFDAACSIDATNHVWMLNGKVIGANAPELKYKFDSAGTYTIYLEVMNKVGKGGKTQKDVTIN